MLADFSRNYCVLCAKFRSQSPTCQPRNQGSYFMSCRLPVKWTVPEQPSVRLMLQVDIIVWMCIVSTSWPINICEHFWHTYTKLHYQTMRDHLKKNIPTYYIFVLYTSASLLNALSTQRNVCCPYVSKEESAKLVDVYLRVYEEDIVVVPKLCVAYVSDLPRLNVKVDKRQTNKKRASFHELDLRVNGLLCFAAIGRGHMLEHVEATAIPLQLNLYWLMPPSSSCGVHAYHRWRRKRRGVRVRTVPWLLTLASASYARSEVWSLDYSCELHSLRTLLNG